MRSGFGLITYSLLLIPTGLLFCIVCQMWASSIGDEFIQLTAEVTSTLTPLVQLDLI